MSTYLEAPQLTCLINICIIKAETSFIAMHFYAIILSLSALTLISGAPFSTRQDSFLAKRVTPPGGFEQKYTPGREAEPENLVEKRDDGLVGFIFEYTRPQKE